jgi:hypothetical protein
MTIPTDVRDLILQRAIGGNGEGSFWTGFLDALQAFHR